MPLRGDLRQLLVMCSAMRAAAARLLSRATQGWLQSEPHSMPTYFVGVFLTGAIMADLNNIVVLRFGSLKLTGVDVFDYLALGLAALLLAAGGLKDLSRAGRLYCV